MASTTDTEPSGSAGPNGTAGPKGPGSAAPLGPSRDPATVRAMFAGIAGRYDMVNRVLSGGIDTRWRKRVIRRAGGDLSGKLALDVACGTGDLAAVLRSAGAKTVGVDFTFEMLQRAPRKSGEVTWVQGDALALPLADDSVDVVTMAFGLRNVTDRRACFRELHRVTRPGGRILILEFGMPNQDLFGKAYRGYLTHVLPRIGGALTGDRAAYTYLDDTVQAWPSHDELVEEMQQDGFVDCRCERLLRGIACLHIGDVPNASSGGAR